MSKQPTQPVNHQVVFDQCKLRWEDEVDYAVTLRDRRKLYTTLIVVAVGLGIFRIDLYVDPDLAPAIQNAYALTWIKVLISSAAFLFIVSFIWLFYSARGKESPKRASEHLELTEIEAAHLRSLHNSSTIPMVHRIESLREATKALAKANRRISGRLKTAATLVMLGYALLTVASLLYILYRELPATANKVPQTFVLRDERTQSDDNNKNVNHTSQYKADRGCIHCPQCLPDDGDRHPIGIRTLDERAN